MKNWVILFARTGSEEKLDGTLKSNLISEEFLPFVPVKEMAYRRKGITIRITSGALTGFESRIKKINRHRREAVVEMQIMDAVREVSLMLEVVEK
jgi:transcription antitermination factor NusG